MRCQLLSIRSLISALPETYNLDAHSGDRYYYYVVTIILQVSAGCLMSSATGGSESG